MTFSEEAFQVLLRWKRRNVPLHCEMAAAGGTGAAYESVQVTELSDDWLTIMAREGFIKNFQLPPGSGVELVGNVPQRFRNRFTKVVRAVSVDGDELFLAEP